MALVLGRNGRRAWRLAGLSVLLVLAAGGCGQLPVGPLVPPALTIRGPALGFPAIQLLFAPPEIGFALAVEHHPGSDTGPVDVFRTGDGGRSWSRVFQTPLTTAAPVALRRMGPSHVALVGLTGVVYVAPAGAGGPWRSVHLPGQTTGADFVSFATPTVWYVLGDVMGAMGHDSAQLYCSVDTGATWQRVEKVGGTPMTGVSFSTPALDSGWVGMSPPVPGVVTLARTGKGVPVGRVPVDRSLLRKYVLTALPPTFFSSDEGVLPIVTGTMPPMTWLTTTRDGGAHWSVPVRLPRNVYAFTDAEHFWAAGANGLWRSVDGGKHWMATALPQGFAVTALDFLTVQRGWALVQHDGRLWVISTHDGGRHWASL